MLDPAYFPVQAQISRGGYPSLFYKASPCPGMTTNIEDELHLFDLGIKKTNKTLLRGIESIIGTPINWRYSDNEIDLDSVIVTDITGSVVYEVNIDYSIGQDGILERLDGHIEDKTIVRVSYSYNENCIDSKTGAPRISCTTCGGTGVLYPETGTPVMGLLHIPSIDDKLVKSGVLRLGEAVYTTSNYIDITTNFEDESRYWLRDKLVIDKVVYEGNTWVKKAQEWIVIKPPASININSTYLANRIFIRLKDKKSNSN